MCVFHTHSNMTLLHITTPHPHPHQAGAILVADPNLCEEAASSGSSTLFMNPHGEVCGWQMAEGVGLDQPQMMRCVRAGCGCVCGEEGLLVQLCSCWRRVCTCGVAS